MTEKQQNMHPFGRLLTHYLRQSQTSQSHFAEITGISDSVISHMKHGRRLKGDNARERVFKMIECFHQQGVLTTRQEANEFLAKAGMLPLSPEPFDKWCLVLEPKLVEQLMEGGRENGDGRAISPSTTKKKWAIRSRLAGIPKKVWWVLTAVLLLTPLVVYAYYYYQTRGWTLRINHTDDINVVLINNEIAVVDGQRFDGSPRIVNLNKYLAEQDANIITLVNINGKSRAWWDFELRYDGTILWHYDDKNENAYQMGYAQSLQLTADGQVIELLPPSITNLSSPPITVTLDVQEIALVLVNGYPVGAASDSPSGEFIPVEISPFLQPGQSNTLEFKFRSTPGEPYRWYIEIWQGDRLWHCLAEDTWQSQVELTELFVIAEQGNLIYAGHNSNCHN